MFAKNKMQKLKETSTTIKQKDLKQCVKNGDLDSIKSYIEANGVDVINASLGLSKTTLLHYAAEFQQKDIVQYLLANNADANKFSSDSAYTHKTPLLSAVINIANFNSDSLEIIKMLVEKSDEKTLERVHTYLSSRARSTSSYEIYQAYRQSLDAIETKFKASTSNNVNVMASAFNISTSYASKSEDPQSPIQELQALNIHLSNKLFKLEEKVSQYEEQFKKITSFMENLTLKNEELSKRVSELENNKPKNNTNPFITDDLSKLFSPRIPGKQ